MDPHDCHFEGWLKTPSAQGPEIFFHSWQSPEVRSKTSATREPYRTTFVNLWTMIQADSLLLLGMNCCFFSSCLCATCQSLPFSGRLRKDTWDQDRRKVPNMAPDPAFWVSACLLEAACLLWLFTGLRSFLDSSEGKTCRQKLALLRSLG